MLHVNAHSLKSYFTHEDFSNKAVGPWDDYYKFTLVRNPWKKMVSYYFYFRPDKNMRPYQRDDKDYDMRSQFHYTFNEWLKKIIDGRGLPNYSYFCCDHEKEDLLLDDVFKVEDINETLPKALSEKAEIDISKIPYLKADYKDPDSSSFPNWKGDYFSLYNEESTQIISQIYKSDIEKFNYKFGE
jgi:hypothetical protein